MERICSASCSCDSSWPYLFLTKRRENLVKRCSFSYLPRVRIWEHSTTLAECFFLCVSVLLEWGWFSLSVYELARVICFY